MPSPKDSGTYGQSHYAGDAYNSASRFFSYGHQLRELWMLHPRNILEVGVGSGVISSVLRNSPVELTTLDFDPELKPDVVASVDDIPLPSETFDVVMCCEVLEHLPFEKFDRALRELHRVSRSHVMITLPQCTPVARLCVPVFSALGRKLVIPLPSLRARRKPQCDEHFWEIGLKGYPLKRIVSAIEAAGFSVIKTRRIWENPYHRMFVLRKKSLADRSGLDAKEQG